MQIDHDPNEPKRGKPSIVWMFSTAAILAVGLAITRGDMQRFTTFETVWLSLAGVSAAIVYFTIIHYLLKGWDWLWARLTGGASR